MIKTPNPVDVHVGMRVRLRRMAIGMSQEKLGERLGLTFQQVQKYEKGANRIGASRLFAISKILDAPIQYFFDEMPDRVDERAARGDVAIAKTNGAPSPSVSAFVATQEGLDLNLAFSKITDRPTRRHLADLIQSVAERADA